MTDAEFTTWKSDFMAAFPGTDAWLSKLPEYGKATIIKWADAFRAVALADALKATERLLIDVPEFWTHQNVPTMIKRLASKASGERRLAERGAAMVPNSEGYECDECRDSGTIDVWAQADIDRCRKQGTITRKEIHCSAIVACNRCKRGRGKYRKYDRKDDRKDRWPMPCFDGRVHCVQDSLDHTDDAIAKLIAFCTTVQEWTPPASYEANIAASQQATADLFGGK